MTPLATNSQRAAREDGQALIELVLFLLICLMIGFGLFEAGILYHNVTVLNRGLNRAATYAAYGAPVPKLQRSVVTEANNLMGSVFLSQQVDTRGLAVTVYDPASGDRIAPTQHADVFHPEEPYVASYMFWAQGYEVRVGIRYRVAFKLPFLRAVSMDLPLRASQRIAAPNDMDRDGMVDAVEQTYVEYAMAEDDPSAYDAGDSVWIHPVHRDGYGRLDTDSGADVDGDDLSGDTAGYDYDNDKQEDRHDSGTGHNRMRYNPIIGPDGWKHM